MAPFPHSGRSWLLAIIAVLSAAATLGAMRPGGTGGDDPLRLAPVVATGIRYDTLLLGGYASGSFTRAVQEIATDLADAERTMVGRHLDRVFEGVLEEDGLGRSGRLRVAFERALRADGSTRSIRVVAAEAAVAGRLYTAFFFEDGQESGFYDASGRSLAREPWISPLSGARVTSGFGPRRMHPILGRVLPHTGLDLAAPLGTPVRASAGGMVAFAGDRGGYGTMVELQHPSGHTTRYAHLYRIVHGLQANQQVQQGEIIGYVGMSGRATGPHLHYEVRTHGRAMDPEIMLASGVSHRLDSPAWPEEQRLLAGLLARTPSLVAGTRPARSP